jgi:hypothetical protein
MEITVRNLPEQTTENSLRKFFRPYLEALSISIFSCQKMRRSRTGTLTFLHHDQGLQFLMKHGQREHRPGYRLNYPNITQLYIMSSPVYCAVSHSPPDTFQLRILEKEASGATSKAKPSIGVVEKAQQAPLTYNSSYASCGIWSYEGSELVFIPHLEWISPGEVRFGARRMMLYIGTKRIEFAYSWIQNITVEGYQMPSMTITCRYAPKFSQKTPETELEMLIKKLNIKVITKEKKKPPWERMSSLGENHQRIVSSCLVYRIGISSPSFDEQIRILKKNHDLPPTIYLRTHVRLPQEALATELARLQQAFTSSFRALPDRDSFAVKFQMQKLAQDGYLPPSTVIKMIPDIVLMMQRSGVAVTVSAIRKLFLEVPYHGPEAEAHEFHVDALLQKLKEHEDRAKREELYMGVSAGTSESDNTANIFRARVTPARVSLHGPEPETKNRVLRKYGFLGFSHSSLRSQTCWFMAPFVHGGKLQLYQLVIANLGDFSQIQSPAKCAARIGQAFSDTPNTVPLGSIVVKTLPDVKRNGRVFSDGVGTFSESVLEHIWDALPSKRLVKPTAFQIRLLGMVRPYGRFTG